MFCHFDQLQTMNKFQTVLASLASKKYLEMIIQY